MPQVVLKTESVDYGGGRGYRTISTTVNVTVNQHTLSFSSAGTTGSVWGICGSTTAYRICVDAQYNTGGGWQTIAHNEMGVAICPSLTNAHQVVNGLVDGLPSVTVAASGQLRLIYYANRNPDPSPDLPNAFPNSTYAEASQTAIHIDVVTDYRPGERKIDGTWRSLNRSGGKCERKVNGSWVELRTENGGVGTGNPPSRKQNGTWYNQRKVGVE